MTTRRSGRALFVELAIVVAGVLIALWADGIATERSQRAELNRHLRAVAAEFREAAQQLDRHVEVSASEMAALDELAALGPSLRTLSADSIVQLVDVGFLRVNVYSPALSALQDLEDSGLVQTIESPELRQELRGVREALRVMASLTEVNQTGPQERRFDEFVLNELPVVWEHQAINHGMRMSPPSIEPDWSPLWSSRGRGLIAMRYDFLSVTTSNWGQFAEGFRGVAELIDDELVTD